MPTMLHRFCLLFFMSLWKASQGETIVRQMHVITRHGSRTPLGKNAGNLQENTPGSLTPYGELQMYYLGKWIADTYNSTGLFSTYSASRVRLESSAFDRTLVSASAFAQGAFPHQARDPYLQSELPTGPSNVPIYSMQVENDVYLRAYDKCETFHQSLEELYASREWHDLEASHAVLLTRLAQLESFRDEADETGKIPLTNVWNVYDSIHVALTECSVSGDFSPTCEALENPNDRFALNGTDFQQLELLTSLVEQMRYGPQRAKHMLGAPLLNRIIGRMQRNPSVGFYLYSAHYATILGVLSALDKRFPLTETIPEYASALIIALVQDTLTNEEFVNVVYKADSILQTPPIVMSFDFCQNETSCPMDTFAGRWKDWSIFQWCRACNNRIADVCLQYWLEETEAVEYGLEEPVQTGLLIGFVVSFFVAVLFCFFCSSTTIKCGGNPPPPQRQETAPTTPRSHVQGRDGDLDHSDSMSSVEMNETLEEKPQPVLT